MTENQVQTSRRQLEMQKWKIPKAPQTQNAQNEAHDVSLSKLHLPLSGWHSTVQWQKLETYKSSLTFPLPLALIQSPCLLLKSILNLSASLQFYQQLLWATGIDAGVSLHLLLLPYNLPTAQQPRSSSTEVTLMLPSLCLTHFQSFSLLNSKNLNP